MTADLIFRSPVQGREENSAILKETSKERYTQLKGSDVFALLLLLQFHF
jgi:hypothetical protein